MLGASMHQPRRPILGAAADANGLVAKSAVVCTAVVCLRLGLEAHTGGLALYATIAAGIRMAMHMECPVDA